MSEPKYELLRRAEVKAWLGISDEELSDFVSCGLIGTVHKRPGAKAMYRRSEIIEKILRPANVCGVPKNNCGTNGHKGVKPGNMHPARKAKKR